MGKLTISMTIFNSKLLVYQRVFSGKPWQTHRSPRFCCEFFLVPRGMLAWQKAGLSCGIHIHHFTNIWRGNIISSLGVYTINQLIGDGSKSHKFLLKLGMCFHFLKDISIIPYTPWLSPGLCPAWGIYAYVSLASLVALLMASMCFLGWVIPLIKPGPASKIDGLTRFHLL